MEERIRRAEGNNIPLIRTEEEGQKSLVEKWIIEVQD